MGVSSRLAPPLAGVNLGCQPGSGSADTAQEHVRHGLEMPGGRRNSAEWHHTEGQVCVEHESEQQQSCNPSVHLMLGGCSTVVVTTPPAYVVEQVSRCGREE
jgi:hypothetical protein